MNSSIIHNIIFDNNGNRQNIQMKGEETIGDLIKKYFEKIKKYNLLLKNIDNIYFYWNATYLNNYTDKTINSIFIVDGSLFHEIQVINGRRNNYNYEIIKTIKENLFSSVFKAKYYNNKLVAIKKIFKDKLKEELKYILDKIIITEKDFEPI